MAGMMKEGTSRRNLQARANYLMESITKKLKENKINRKLIRSLEKETKEVHTHNLLRNSLLQILIKDYNKKKTVNIQTYRLIEILKNNIVNMNFRQELAKFIKNKENKTRTNINVATDLIQYLRSKSEEGSKEIRLNTKFVKFLLNDILTNKQHVDQEVEELTRIEQAL